MRRARLLLLIGFLIELPSCSQRTGPVVVVPPPASMPVALASPAITANGSLNSAPAEPFVAYGTGQTTDRLQPALLVGQNATATDVTLNFAGADVTQVVKSILGDILHEAYVIDPTVSGTITFQTAAPIPRSSVLPALEQILRMSGIGIAYHGGIYQVQPLPQATQDLEVIPAGGAGYGDAIVPLRYVAAADIQKLLVPISPAGSIAALDSNRNILVISGTTEERRAILANVRVFDVDWMAGMSFGMFPLATADASQMATDVQALIGGSDGPMAGVVRIMPIERLNAILVISQQPRYIREIAGWIQRLDAGQDSASAHVYVYYVKNGRATDMASVLNRLLGSGNMSSDQPTTPNVTPQPTSTASGSGSSGFGGAPTANSTPAVGPGLSTGPASAGPSPEAAMVAAANPANTGNAGADGSDEIEDSGSSSLRITADNATNAVLIYATARQYRDIESAIQRLDIAPLQVLLEATVAEVDLNKDLQYGVQYYLAHGNNQADLGGSSVSGTASTPTTPVFALGAGPATVTSAFPGGLGYLFSSGQNTRVILNALSNITNVNVISAPKLLVLSNQSAQLQVGDQVPVVTSQATSVSSAGAPIVNSISYLSTGVILQVTPRVNEGGLVMMDVSQEVSSVVASTVATSSTSSSPTIQDRKITTTIAVQDGETVALGGLIQNQTSRDHTGIPLLQDIPGVGALFRSTDRAGSRTELLVLITPHIIQSVQRLRDLTDEMSQEMSQAHALMLH